MAARRKTAAGAASGRKPARKAGRRPRGAPARARRILELLRRHYPDADCALDHRNPLELLVATILSAQCTDARVNQVTPELFERFPDAAAYARAESDEIERLIHSTGFFRQKTRSIQGMARQLSERHGGEVPASMEQLLELPGVARKTANVVLGTAFGLEQGVVVDTHVKRLAGRLGLSSQAEPEAIERDLMALFPRDSWTFLSHALILHGRGVCSARAPRCEDCPLADPCPSEGHAV